MLCTLGCARPSRKSQSIRSKNRDETWEWLGVEDGNRPRRRAVAGPRGPGRWAADPSLTEGSGAILRGHARRTAGGQFANPPTAPSVGGVEPLCPVGLDDRGFTPPFGGVRNSLKDKNLSLSPPTLSGIWTNGGVNAGATGFHPAKAWRSEEAASGAQATGGARRRMCARPVLGACRLAARQRGEA